MRLRELCLSAAQGIRDECARVLYEELGEPAAQCVGAPNQHKDRGADQHHHHEDAYHTTTKATAPINSTSSLADCDEPLVQLLARQAVSVLALYEPLSPGPTLAPASVGPGQPAEKEQRPDAMRPAASDGGQRQPHHDVHASRAEGPIGQGPAVGGDGGLVLKRLDDLLSIAYSRFYAYLYKDLPLCWRQLYTDAAILKFSYLRLSLHDHGHSQRRKNDANVHHAAALPPADFPPHNTGDDTLNEMVRILDLALLLAGAGGEDRGRAWINKAFELLECVVDGPGSTRQTPAVSVNHGQAVDTAVACAGSRRPPAKRAKVDASTRLLPWAHQPSFSTLEPFTPAISYPIRRVSAHDLDMSAFQRYLNMAPSDLGPEPLVIADLAEEWPARTTRPWNKPSYLLSRTLGGRRLVPVEIGRSYVDEGWGQKIIRFGDFLADYVDTAVLPPDSEGSGKVHHADSPAKPTAYLAQHALLLQLPQLRNDILIPDLCYTAPPGHPHDPSQDQPELDAPMLNAWLGPPGTITPLHTDPYHNLLVQVVGRKYIRLYAPHQSAHMRARGKEAGVDMGNTSRWDVGLVEGWDSQPADSQGEEQAQDRAQAGDDRPQPAAAAPAARADEQQDGLASVPFVDCLLGPGDTLYIPIGWWHYVRGLSVSFSVSIWWN